MSESVARSIETAILEVFTDASVVVHIGSPGHYSIEVTDASFAGQNTLTRQRRVYATIKELMAGIMPARNAAARAAA